MYRGHFRVINAERSINYLRITRADVRLRKGCAVLFAYEGKVDLIVPFFAYIYIVNSFNGSVYRIIDNINLTMEIFYRLIYLNIEVKFYLVIHWISELFD